MLRLRVWVAAAILLIVADGCSAAGLLRSHVQLQQAIYTDVSPANACVRLLNATHEIGCAVAGGGTTKGALMHWSDLTSGALPDGLTTVILAKPAELTDALAFAAKSSNIRGILVRPGPAPEEGLSEAAAFPGAAYAPYPNRSHAWNPRGTGVDRRRVDVPVMLLSGGAAADARRRASGNALQGFEGAVHYAELQSTMHGTRNSSACIAGAACLPLGSHSVWAAMPPLLPSDDTGGAGKRQQPLPITLVVASVNGGGLFHDSIVGAEAPMSGLIAMLAAADALHSAQLSGKPLRRRIVFAALAGESWDYMGSRRLLWEMHRGRNATAGLDLELIDQVIELGQLGRGRSQVTDGSRQQEAAGWQAGEGPARFYVHTQRDGAFGDASAVADALRAAGNATQQAVVSEASLSNPGVPPGSLFSFLRAKPSVAAAALTDFDTTYSNRFYGSRFDNGSNADVGRISAAVAVVARALDALALGPDAAPLQVNQTAVAELVTELWGCLVLPEPGLQCELVQRLTATSGASAQHYVGILHTLTTQSQDPDPSVKGDLPRFLWNFLAERTAAPQAASGSRGGEPCDFGQHACSGGGACVGYRGTLKWPESAGRCVLAMARYVPAYSTALRCDGCDGAATFYNTCWKVTDEAAAWQQKLRWPPDPMWTESNWPAGQPSVLLYQAENPAVVRATWLLGAASTAGTVAALAAARAYGKRLDTQ